MKLITTCPLVHYEFTAVGPQIPSEALAARQSYYDSHYDQAEPALGLGTSPQLQNGLT